MYTLLPYVQNADRRAEAEDRCAEAEGCAVALRQEVRS